MCSLVFLKIHKVAHIAIEWLINEYDPTCACVCVCVCVTDSDVEPETPPPPPLRNPLPYEYAVSRPIYEYISD